MVAWRHSAAILRILRAYKARKKWQGYDTIQIRQNKMTELPDIMEYTGDYILSSEGDAAVTYLGEKQVLSLLGPREDSLLLLDSLPKAMELVDGTTRVPIYLWRDVHALLVKEGLNKSDFAPIEHI